MSSCLLLANIAYWQNNANEGSLIPPSNIVTQDDLVAWIKSNFPNLSEANITNILAAYPSSSDPVDSTAAKYETSGYGPGTAVNISQVATGQQQRCYVSFGLPETVRFLLIYSVGRISTPKQPSSVPVIGLRLHLQVKPEPLTTTNTRYRLLCMAQTSQHTTGRQQTAKVQTLSQRFKVSISIRNQTGPESLAQSLRHRDLR
jgi:hypothetical protein